MANNFEIDSITTVVDDFLENSNDDEAVELVAALWTLLLESSSQVGILNVENILLNRDLDKYEAKDELKKFVNDPSTSNMVS